MGRSGARRGRHRQDPGADHANCPYSSFGRARPYEILAVTFTNKAAREMKGRIGELIGRGRGHALARHVPRHRGQDHRRHAELVGLKSDFTILDTDDQIR